MNIQNVKLDWDSILERQINWLEKLYDSDQIRPSYEAIIPLLTENKIPSRVIISGGKVVAYAFYITDNDGNDRLYATMGFHNTLLDEQKIASLLDWLKTESKRQNKTVIMNGIFNEPENFKEIASKNGFNSINRVRMELSLDKIMLNEGKEDTRFTFTTIDKGNLTEACDLIFDAFRSLPERILLPVGDNKTSMLAHSLMNSTYGKLIEEISYLASENDNSVGGVIFTDGSTELKRIPLLLFIFVLDEYRGQGISEAIMERALLKIKKLGFEGVQLWVDKNNFAYKMYRKFGFQEYENEKTPIYYFNP